MVVKERKETSAQRWASYAKAAGIGAFALGAAGNVDAAIIANGGTHNGAAAALPIVITPPAGDYLNVFDLDGDGTKDFGMGTGGYGSTFGYDSGGYAGTIFTSADATTYAEAFAVGSFINGAAAPSGVFFSVNVLNPATTFGDGDRGFMGFQTSDGSFGYMDISMKNVGDLTFNGIDDLELTIHGWFVEDSGAEIEVTPEPTSLALLAVGSVGLLARRRKNVA